jgi:hypothetical protein
MVLNPSNLTDILDMESWIEISEEWEEKIHNYLEILTKVVEETESELFLNRVKRQDWMEKHQSWSIQDTTTNLSE